MRMNDDVDIAIFGSFKPAGGIYRRLTNQIQVWHRLGMRTALVTFRKGVQFFPEEMPESVSFHDLKTRSRPATTLALAAFLYRYQPQAVLSITHASNTILARTAYFPGIHSRRILSVPNTFGASEKQAESPKKRDRKFREIQKVYPLADGLIAISQGVQDDLKQIGLRNLETRKIYSGTITRHTYDRARLPANHRWLGSNHAEPVLVAAGRLAPQKDYPNLLHAFARACEAIPARLIILGEGEQRYELQSLANELGIGERVDLCGHVDNPYPYMAQADLFVLSSRWEGLVNVVIEALALGTPVVSTDCPSGPREILEDGRYGILVPPRDPDALAEGILKGLRGETPEYDPAEAVDRFRAERAARAYLDFMGITPPVSPS